MSNFNTPAKFFSKVRKTDSCWFWEGYCDPQGYGRFKHKSKTSINYLAHRYAYELLVGPIPEGMQLDHLCRNTSCVNPSHLEPVTNRENAIRGNSLNAINARKTHCDQGHAFTPENTYIRPDNGQRNCRVCKSETRKRFYVKNGY